MKKMLFSAVLTTLIIGCTQQMFIVGDKLTVVIPKKTITHHFFASGIGQKETIDTAKVCGGAENVVKAETQQTFVNGLLGFITSGIYTPLEVHVYCSQGLHELPIDMGNPICTAHQYTSGFFPAVFAQGSASFGGRDNPV